MLNYDYLANVDDGSCITVDFDNGYNAGWIEGWNQAWEDIDNIFDEGYNSGWIEGWNQAWDSISNTTVYLGYTDSYETVINIDSNFIDNVFYDGYSLGFTSGFSESNIYHLSLINEINGFNYDTLPVAIWDILLNSDSIEYSNGYNDGQNSVDILSAIDEGYNLGFQDGLDSSIFITTVYLDYIDSLEALLSSANLQIEMLELMMESTNSGGNCDPIYINLQQGWNMIGYTLPEPQDVAATLGQYPPKLRFLKIIMLMFIGPNMDLMV